MQGVPPHAVGMQGHALAAWQRACAVACWGAPRRCMGVEDATRGGLRFGSCPWQVEITAQQRTQATPRTNAHTCCSE